jgi:hypothetical protein
MTLHYTCFGSAARRCEGSILLYTRVKPKTHLPLLSFSQLFFLFLNIVRSKEARAFYCRLKGETKLEGPNENGESCARRQMKPSAVTNHNLLRLVCSSGDCVN